jgi:glycogen synthase
VHPSGRPLLAVVSRLTEQKGLPLILHGMRVALEAGAQVNECVSE